MRGLDWDNCVITPPELSFKQQTSLDTRFYDHGSIFMSSDHGC